MNSETFQVYRHSGKFGMHGPLLTLAIAAVAAFPLGFAYAYIVRWIPFVYVHVFATAGYGFVMGLAAGYGLRLGKVRNTTVALLTGLVVGIIALYFAWSAHINATFHGAPVLATPDQVLGAMKRLYEEGSWAMRGGGSLTGIPLAIVWVVEALIIMGMTVGTAFVMISNTPFCELNQCWLDKEKKIDTLESFTDAEQVAALKAGDLSPLAKAKPRTPGSPTFARLTLKHSPRCNDFYTVRIQDILIERDKEGKPKEKVTDITKDLMLPHRMFELIAKFEGFKAAEAPAVQT
jgi:hypothetical protein